MKIKPALCTIDVDHGQGIATGKAYELTQDSDGTYFYKVAFTGSDELMAIKSARVDLIETTVELPPESSDLFNTLDTMLGQYNRSRREA